MERKGWWTAPYGLDLGIFVLIILLSISKQSGGNGVGCGHAGVQECRNEDAEV